MINTVLKLSSTILIVLLCVLLSATFWLVSTESGLHWAFEKSKHYIPGDLHINKLQGSLLGSIDARQIEYKLNGNQIGLKHLRLDWSLLGLLDASINIHHLQLDSLDIKLSQTGQRSEEFVLPEILLPWPVLLKNTTVNQLVVKNAEKILAIKTLKIDAFAHLSHVNINTLTINQDDLVLNINGKLRASHNYPHKFNIKWEKKLASSEAFAGQGQIEGNVETVKVQQQINTPVKATLNANIHDLLKQMSWQANAYANNINPGVIWPEWPGQLNAKLSSQGQIKNGQLFAHAGIEQLNGTLRNYPVSLSGQIDWRNNGIDINKALFQFANSRMTANGRIDDQLNLNWNISSTNLHELYPQAQGKFEANGQLTGTPAAPLLNSRFNAKTLGIKNMSIGKITGTLYSDLFNWQASRLELKAHQLNYETYSLDSLVLKANSHQLDTQMTADNLSASLRLKGKLFKQYWQGQVTSTELSSNQYNNWTLKEPVDLIIRPSEFKLESLCLTSDKAEVCNRTYQQSQQWHTAFQVSHFPLKTLRLWLPDDLKVEGTANASAEFTLLPSHSVEAKASIALPSGKISFPLINDERGSWEYRNATIKASMDSRGLYTSTVIAMDNGDHIKGQIILPGLQTFSLDTKNQKILAKAQVDIHDLGIIEAVLPDVQNLKGALKLNFSADGTLDKPRLYSQAEFKNGSLQIPRLGLNINNVYVKSFTDDQQKLNYTASANSADGNLKVQGHTLLDKNRHWPTEILIDGNDFEFSNIPEARALASPKLKISIVQRSINITGNVEIPYAKLQPRDISSAAHVSNDVFIIGDKNIKEEKWLIHTKIRLSLGERVSFYGFGFEGRFAGNLLLEDEPGQFSKAIGEVTVPEGRYRAYGQRLDVQQGRIIYTGGPVTNPGIDLRAVRNAGDVVAGIKVRGTFHKPEFELFSIPAMGQTDALSYLVLGHSVKSATNEEGSMVSKAALALSLGGGDYIARTFGDRFGLDEMRVENSNNGDQASLIIGRYLSPKLYISYGLGLIESANTINLRYQISEKWQVKSESGSRQSADLFYTFER